MNLGRNRQRVRARYPFVQSGAVSPPVNTVAPVASGTVRIGNSLTELERWTAYRNGVVL